MGNETILLSSGMAFKAFEPGPDYYANSQDILKNKDKYKNILNRQGFLVVKDIMNKKKIEELRDEYYKLFNQEYEKRKKVWYQLKEPKDSHGYGNHPVKNYLKSEKFLSFNADPYLREIVSVLLQSKEISLSKRILVRSFSKLSTFTTSAHRDKEYYVSSNPLKVLTTWIPLGAADREHGQLVYLENSQNFSFVDKSDKDKKERVISKDLNNLATKMGSRWLIPKISMGDVIFHSLNTVHASFDSNTLRPRLSCDLRFASSNQFLDPRWKDYWYGEDGL